MKRFRCFLILPFTLILFSCSPQRVLVLTDPVFDYFASEQISFYNASRFLIFLKSGYIPEFLVTGETDLLQAQSRIDSGKFSAVITGYLNFFDLEIPPDMKTVLIGGSREIRYETSSQVLYSNIEAFRHLSNRLYSEWKKNGKIPIIVFWKNPRVGDEELQSLLSVWDEDDRHIVNENLLILTDADSDIQNLIEVFFRKYNFSEQNVVVAGVCPPVLDEFLKSLPGGAKPELILSVPDNPHLPKTVVSIITPAYKMIIKESIIALNEYAPGNIHEIQNIYKNK